LISHQFDQVLRISAVEETPQSVSGTVPAFSFHRLVEFLRRYRNIPKPDALKFRELVRQGFR
jgi:hypothetical protein